VKGLLVGQLTEIKEDDPPFGKSPEEIIREAVKEYDFPVCFGFPAGHGEVNKALIFGAPVQITVSAKRATVKFKT
jgi:muramoyltetrapeptide carboxypeptidase